MIQWYAQVNLTVNPPGSRSHSTILISCLAGGGIGMALIGLSILVFSCRRRYMKRATHHAAGGSDTSSRSSAPLIEPYTVTQPPENFHATRNTRDCRRHIARSVDITLYEEAQDATLYDSTNPPSTIDPRQAVRPITQPDVTEELVDTPSRRHHRHTYGLRKVMVA